MMCNSDSVTVIFSDVGIGIGIELRTKLPMSTGSVHLYHTIPTPAAQRKCSTVSPLNYH